MRGEDLLSTLEPYFTNGLSVNDIDKVTVLHDIFEKDFFTDGVTIDGEKLKVKPYKYRGSSKDRLPVDYELFYETPMTFTSRPRE